MREIISLNGTYCFALEILDDNVFSEENDALTPYPPTVGQAGCQIANSCWEVNMQPFPIVGSECS
jgi:hypothetical protein